MQFPRCWYNHPYHLPLLLLAGWPHPVVLCTSENKTCCWGMRSSLHRSSVIALRELQTVSHHVVHHLWVSCDCYLEQDDSMVEQRTKWRVVVLFWGWCCHTTTAVGRLWPPQWHPAPPLIECIVHMPSSHDKPIAKEEEWFSDQLSAYGALSKGECWTGIICAGYPCTPVIGS